jgi:hypothetical protein
MSRVPHRLVLLALAVAAVAVGVSGLHRADRCDGAIAVAQRGDVAAVPAVARWCRDSHRAVVAAAFLRHLGQPGAALAVMRHVTVTDPRDELGWLTVGRILGTRSAEGRRAFARARALDPPAP